MRRIVVLLAVVLLTACSSSSKHSTPPPSTTTIEASSSTTAAPTRSTTTTSSPKPSNASTTTTAGGFSSSVKIDNFTYTGASPVDCNAPTTIDLRWKVTGASSVEMHIDGGPVFARYGNGARTETLPIQCDDKSHTYTLTAAGGGSTAKQSVTVQTNRTA